MRLESGRKLTKGSKIGQVAAGGSHPRPVIRIECGHTPNFFWNKGCATRHSALTTKGNNGGAGAARTRHPLKSKRGPSTSVGMTGLWRRLGDVGGEQVKIPTLNFVKARNSGWGTRRIVEQSTRSGEARGALVGEATSPAPPLTLPVVWHGPPSPQVHTVLREA